LVTEPKKTVLESLAAIASALGGARTPVSQALVEVGIFLGLIAGANWIYEHATPSVKPTLAICFAFFGLFVGFALFVRVVAAVMTAISGSTKK
jgi:hypothetical protein